MAKTNSTIDEDLYAGLQQVRKKKPRNYCLVIRGQNVFKLIVQKKKISEGVMKQAKSEYKGNEVISGVVVGEGNELAFQVLLEEPSLKPNNLRDFISTQAEINCKPRWVVVKEFDEVPEDETETDSPAAPSGETAEKVEEKSGDSDLKPEDEFAAGVREQIAAREKTIKAGLEWARKNSSPHAEAIAEGYEAAGEKLKNAKAEPDFEAAVQAHDDVIALIRTAIKESQGPAKEEKAKPPVPDEKTFKQALTNAANTIKRLRESKFVDETELQELVGLTKLVDSQVKSKEYERAAIALDKLQKGLKTVDQKAKSTLRQRMKEYAEHPDSKYIQKTILNIGSWKGFDEKQRAAGRKAFASNAKMRDFDEDFEVGVKLRDQAVTDCKAWDAEVERVAKAREGHDKVYAPHKSEIESAGILARKKGLPDSVQLVATDYAKKFNKWNEEFRHDRFDDAIPLIEPLAEVSRRLIDEEKSFREAKARFDLANEAIDNDVREARKFARLLAKRKLNIGQTKKLCDDVETASNKVNEKLKTFDYDGATPLVNDVKNAVDELLKFKGIYTNAKKTGLKSWSEGEHDRFLVRDMPKNHPKFSGDVQTMNTVVSNFMDVYYKQFDYVRALTLIDGLNKAVAKVKLAYEQMIREKTAYYSDWDPHEDDYIAVKNLGERDKKVKLLVDNLKKAWTDMNNKLTVYDYVAAKGLVPPVVEAIKPLLTERPKQESEWNKALKKVQKIHKKWKEVPRIGDELIRLSRVCFDRWWEADKLAKEGDFLGGKAKLVDFVKAYDAFAKAVVAHDKVALPAAKEARQDVEKLVKNGELKNKSVAEKKILLEKLRGATTMGKDERKAQRAIYKTIDLDPDFLEEDEVRLEEIADSLTDSEEKREELTDFRDNWTKKTLEQKLGIVKKSLKAQCEAMGFGDKPPEIATFDKKRKKGLITDGYFDPDDGKIYLNTNSEASLSIELESTLDLIFHENSHNFQNMLAKKFKDGAIDPSDPEYKQAELFALNTGAHSYVEGAEDFEVYKKQPMEEHAHYNGAQIAKAVFKQL